MGVGTFLKRMTGQKTGKLVNKWNYTAGGTLLSSPVVDDLGTGKRHILVGTKSGRLLALDENAKLLWQFDAAAKIDEVSSFFVDEASMNSIPAPPAVVDLNGDGKKEILFGTEAGMLYALDSKGKQLWTCKTNGAIKGTPILHTIKGKHHLVIGSADHNVYLLNATGKVVWSYDAGAEITSTAEIMTGKRPQILIGTKDGRLLSLSESGELNWTFQTKDKITAQPAIHDIENNPLILIGSHDNVLYALNELGEQQWTFPVEGAIMTRSTVTDINNDGKKEIIFGSCDNKAYVLDHQGRKLWSFETDFWVVAPLLVMDIDKDGTLEIVLGSYDRNIYILDSKGSYVLDYVPGISGVAAQPGHYSEVMTASPGEMFGKKLWQYETEGIVVGCALIPDKRQIIITTDKGIIKNITHGD